MGVITCDPDASITDPGLLKKHSTYRSYTAGGFVYPAIRTFHHPHPQAAKLPSKPTPIPLLVFIHGLGGSAAQFAPLLTSLINAAPCLAIDLPGCGLSAFEPKKPEAYSPEAMARLIAEAISQYRDAEKGQKVVLIGHSMGCSLAALLATSNSPILSTTALSTDDIAGLVAICPKAEPPSASQVSRLKHLRYMPLAIFELYRAFDRRGGVDSPSVARYTGTDADPETKRLQLRFNEQSKSDVFMTMALGLLPNYNEGHAVGGLPGKEIWSELNVPTFLMAGENDHVCPPSNVELIAQWLGHGTKTAPAPAAEEESSLPAAAGDAHMAGDKEQAPSPYSFPKQFPAIAETQLDLPMASTPSSPPDTSDASTTRSRLIIKTSILPGPEATHALPYATSTVRVLSGLLQTFISNHVDKRLSLGWQLQHLTTEGKWDVKNLAKWQAIEPVSVPIGEPVPVFRAMKTLREVDEVHTPKVFATHWGVANKRHGTDADADAGANVDGIVKNRIRMVVDISHESPVYDPKGLEEGGIEYHKFPTVSKLPPTVDEVRAFIALIDSLRGKPSRTNEDHADEGLEEERDEDEEEQKQKRDGTVIGVHCHYGFNRTGFFIVCYLVERLGYKLQDALDEFAEKRAPGIRHEHFVNELFVRYTVGLMRRPTLCA